MESMRPMKTAPVLALWLVACASTPEPFEPRLSEADYVRHVEYLASDALEGRKAGSRGELLATTYVAAEFERAGVEPFAGHEYFAPVLIEDETETVTGRNVVGVVPGTVRPNEYLLVIAHHDGLGHCPPDDRGDDICNGAIDNASGVALLLELAEEVAARPLARSVVFLSSSGEESGLWGARAFVADPLIPLNSIDAVFGLDTVAAIGRSDSVGILGAGLTDLDPLIEAEARAHDRPLRQNPVAASFYSRSDHFVFAEAGVPAIMVGGLFGAGQGGANPLASGYMRERYHRPNDAFDPAIDWSGALADGELLLDIMTKVAARETRVGWAPNSPYQRH